MEFIYILFFNCEVTKAEWKENLNAWEVETNQGDVFHAKTFFLASGGLSQISMPDIKGLEKFKGNLFHSTRLDHSVSLTGKRVGVIGL